MNIVSCSKSRGDRPRRAFTLIELLIVIGIIALLVVATLVVGSTVVTGSKARLTEDTIRVMDAAMQSYIKNKDGIPSLSLLDPRDPANTANAQRHVVIASDVRNMRAGDADQQMLNGIGWFLHQAEAVSAVSTSVGELADRVRKLGDVDSDGYGATGRIDQLSPPPPGDLADQPYMLTVFDGWGRPLRYVHPALDGLPGVNNPGDEFDTDQVVSGVLTGAQTFSYPRLRRNNVDLTANPSRPSEFADSDGGNCVSERPYFYSAGADGRVGWNLDRSKDFNADNVYTTKPVFSRD